MELWSKCESFCSCKILYRLRKNLDKVNPNYFCCSCDKLEHCKVWIFCLNIKCKLNFIIWKICINVEKFIEVCTIKWKRSIENYMV